MERGVRRKNSIIGGRSQTGRKVYDCRRAKTVLAAYHTNDPNAGMANSRDLNKFKLFLADTGLFATAGFVGHDKRLINQMFSVFLTQFYQ